MINILFFFYLSKIFGLAPFALQVESIVNRKTCLKILWRIPTFLMIFFYTICVCSIFYKNKLISEISNTANWIQVEFFSFFIKNIFLEIPLQFIPNASIFFIVLVAADRSRATIQSIGFLVFELDNKLKCYQVSHVASNKRIKRLAVFASFRKSDFLPRLISFMSISHS